MKIFKTHYSAVFVYILTALFFLPVNEYAYSEGVVDPNMSTAPPGTCETNPAHPTCLAPSLGQSPIHGEPPDPRTVSCNTCDEDKAMLRDIIAEKQSEITLLQQQQETLNTKIADLEAQLSDASTATAASHDRIGQLERQLSSAQKASNDKELISSNRYRGLKQWLSKATATHESTLNTMKADYESQLSSAQKASNDKELISSNSIRDLNRQLERARDDTRMMRRSERKHAPTERRKKERQDAIALCIAQGKDAFQDLTSPSGITCD